MGKLHAKSASRAPKLKNNKSLGQHWLRDRGILNEIAELSIPFAEGVAEGSVEGVVETGEELPVCVEIGPGLGTLTSSLLRIYPRVVAVEFDERLAENLPKSFPGKNLEVWHEDFLRTDLSKLPKGYVVCANIPYYITSPIITKLVEAKNPPARVVLLVQKEVAERVVAGDNPLALFAQNRAFVSLGPVVGREFFTPPPKVDSQVLVLEPHAPLVSDGVLKLIRIGFSSPRKKLVKNLRAAYHEVEFERIFEKLGLSIDARPGDLGLAEWGKLAGELQLDRSVVQ